MKLLQHITLAKASYDLILLTVVFALSSIALSVVTPVLLKQLVDSLPTHTQVPWLAIILLASAFIFSQIFAELRWWAYSNADENNFTQHIEKILSESNDMSAIRAHKSALGNRLFISTTLFTLTPIVVEVILGSILVFNLMPPSYALIYLSAALLQLSVGVLFTYRLNPIFTNTRELEVAYFQALSNDDRDINRLKLPIQAWYQGIKRINMMRTMVKTTSLIWPTIGLIIINILATKDFQLKQMSLGDILAINTYLLQSSTKIEMVSNSLRDAIMARNDIFAAFRDKKT